MAEYRLIKDSVQDQFGALRTKVQIFGGGFGNGKTAAAVVQKVLKIAKEYPGANILVARSTYPKLNDTIRKEFLKWCPPKWIKSFPLSKNSDNTCHMTNGTMINFRYIAQQGKGANEGEATTSNLLSATYDLIVVDQLEDPEIVEKDFDDLLGRLRGNAKYIGNDPSMPTTGPRWLVACVNPTRNWVYRRLIAPLLKYQQTAIIDKELLVKRHKRDSANADEPILDADGKPELLISLVEGSTYTNAHNLGSDFIETLESAYRGQMRDRFLYGEWAAYEGLVYPEFSELSHCYTQAEMYEQLIAMDNQGYDAQFIESYDYGMVSPSCYLLAFTDKWNNVYICDGFYKPEQEMHIDVQQERIHELRSEWGAPEDGSVLADPSVFRKSKGGRTTGAKTVAELFNEGDHAVKMRRAENEILSGITKVGTYLSIKPTHRNPFTKQMGGSHLYIATELQFLVNEFTGYYWKQNPAGQRIDEPVDKNDHSMDALKYLLSKRPTLAVRRPKVREKTYLHSWSEGRDTTTNNVRHRYG